jgi:hypothetical protein
MRNKLLGAAGVTVAVISVALYNQTALTSWMVRKGLEWRLENATATVRDTSFDRLISDDVVRQTLNDRNGGLYGARKAFFDKYLCGPVFGDKHDDRDEKRGENSVCFDVLYVDGGANVEWWYSKRNLPISVAPLVSLFRSVTTQRARQYLVDPDRLRGLYKAHESMAVNHIRSLAADEQSKTVEWLRSLHMAFSTFYSVEVQDAYALVLKTERDWLENNRKERALGETTTKRSMDDDLRPFRVWEEAKDKLRATSPDLMATMFAGRRHEEGGRVLVEAYAAIFAELIDKVK